MTIHWFFKRQSAWDDIIDIDMRAGGQVLAAAQGGVTNATSGLEVGAGRITVNISDR